MALNKVIVTPAEADVYLANKADWIELSDSVKSVYIARASVYIQTSWTCEDVDWSDNTTISDIIKESCSYYAYADFKGNLFPDLDIDSTPLGRVTQHTQKLEGLEETYKYSDTTGSITSNPLSYPDTLINTECSRVKSAQLTRV